MLFARLTSTNVLVIRVNTVEHVRIKLMDLSVVVRLDFQVDFLLVYTNALSLSVIFVILYDFLHKLFNSI